jgi:hypothetical protein
MKRTLLVLLTLGIFAGGGFAAWLFFPSRIASDVIVAFVSYTSDAHGFRSRFYSVPDSSDQSMIVFQATNRSDRSCVFWPGIELKQSGGWIPDPNQLPYPGKATGLPGRSVATVVVPNPPGSSPVRCRLYMVRPVRANWQDKVMGILRLRDERGSLDVSSPEMIR